MLDITPHDLPRRGCTIALARVKHVYVGLAKAPVFALFIALIGCRMGMTVSRDTRSIGINTTSTVVQSIVAVILLDAGFAVVFQELESDERRPRRSSRSTTIVTRFGGRSCTTASASRAARRAGRR